MEKTKVAIIGLGTVGSGVARLLLDHGDRTARHAGRTLWLEKAVVRDLAKARECDLPEGVLTDDVDEVIDDPEIEVVAQLIGGLEPARTIMLKLLESGKDVVTANKALLAEHGPELFDRARELGRSIAFEASVAGGIPIIAGIGQCLSANQIESLHGILNGTSNFILTRWTKTGPTTPTSWPRPSGSATPRPTRRWTSTAPTPPRSWPSWPSWRFGARVRLGRHSAHRHRHARRGRPALRPGAGLPDQAAGRGRAGATTGWSCTSRRRWSGGHAAGRGPRGLQRGPRGRRRGRARCSSTGWAPARCRPPRPSWPT